MDWELVQRLFHAASERPESERPAFLDEVCHDAPEVRAKVEELLAVRVDAGYLEPRDEVDFVLEHLEQLGRYELKERIGSGSMGVVYHAFDPELGRDLALKCLPLHLTLSPTQLRRFQGEARAAAGLVHPNIVRIHDVGETAGHHYFTMDLHPGPDLAVELARLRAGGSGRHLPAASDPAYPARVAELLASVSDALQYAHERRIVHRDVKPANLLFDARGELVLADFGLARQESLGSLTDSRTILGTPHYMSPEQAAVGRLETVDHRSDIYSLGVVLYELLTLARPFEGDTNEQILHSIVTREAPRPQRVRLGDEGVRVPTEIARVCEQAIAKRREERYQTAGELAEDLRRFVTGEPTRARVPAWPVRAARKARRHKRSVTVASAVLLLGAGYGWMDHQVQSAEEQLSAAEQTTVRLEVVDRSGAPIPDASGTVVVHELDPDTTTIGATRPPSPLGEPIEGLELGQWRFRVEFDDGASADVTRWIDPSDGELDVTVVHRPDLVQDPRMVAFEACTWHTPGDSWERNPFVERAVQLEPFEIQRREVVNSEFREYVLETGADPPWIWDGLDWRAPGLIVELPDGRMVAFDDLPVTGVTFGQARGYAEWCGWRLPTWAETQRASRGLELRETPSGQELEADVSCVLWDTFAMFEEPADNLRDALAKLATAEDHRGDITTDGVVHLLGNAKEWTESLPRNRYDGGEWDPDPNQRITHSRAYFEGSFDPSPDLTTFSVEKLSEPMPHQAIGFRCARSVTRSE